jgi:hypothetical protein
MQDAKDLHSDITRLLITLQTLQENLQIKSQEDQLITVQMDGGQYR